MVASRLVAGRRTIILGRLVAGRWLVARRRLKGWRWLMGRRMAQPAWLLAARGRMQLRSKQLWLWLWQMRRHAAARCQSEPRGGEVPERAVPCVHPVVSRV